MNILIVIDVQDGFLKDDFKNSYIEKLETIIGKGYNGVHFEKVIGTRFINLEYSSFRLNKGMDWHIMGVDDVGITINKNIEKYLCKIIDKNGYGLNISEIKDDLNKNKDTIYLVGMDTDCCILATAINLFEYGYDVKVIKDGCYSSGGEVSHQSGLICLNRLIGKRNII